MITISTSEAARRARREYYRHWREVNAEKLREYRKAWIAAHKDYLREYNERYWERKAVELAKKQQRGEV